MDISISAAQIISVAAVITALATISGAFVALYKWYLRQNKDSQEIKKLKHENALICYALSACLDGLIQLGANHNVPKIKDKLDKYLNQLAHDQLEEDD